MQAKMKNISALSLNLLRRNMMNSVNVPAKQIHHTAGLPKVEMVPNFVVSGFCPPE